MTPQQARDPWDVGEEHVGRAVAWEVRAALSGLKVRYLLAIVFGLPLLGLSGLALFAAPPQNRPVLVLSCAGLLIVILTCVGGLVFLRRRPFPWALAAAVLATLYGCVDLLGRFFLGLEALEEMQGRFLVQLSGTFWLVLWVTGLWKNALATRRFDRALRSHPELLQPVERRPRPVARREHRAPAVEASVARRREREFTREHRSARLATLKSVLVVGAACLVLVGLYHWMRTRASRPDDLAPRLQAFRTDWNEHRWEQVLAYYTSDTRTRRETTIERALRAIETRHGWPELREPAPSGDGLRRSVPFPSTSGTLTTRWVWSDEEWWLDGFRFGR